MVRWATRVTFDDKGASICGKKVKNGDKRITNLQSVSRNQLDKGTHRMALLKHIECVDPRDGLKVMSTTLERICS